MSVSARSRKECGRCGGRKAWSRKAFASHQKTCPGPPGTKVGKTVLDAFLHVNKFGGLSKREFDKVVGLHGVHHDDDRLIDMLVGAGWHFLPLAEEGDQAYIKAPEEDLPLHPLTAEEVIEREIRNAGPPDYAPPRGVSPSSHFQAVLREVLAKIRWAKKRRLVG